jgi:hypothetical protein
MPKQRKRRASRSSVGRALDSRVGIYGNAFGQMKRDLGWLMRVVNVEDKYIDTLFAANNMSNAIGNQSLLNGCVQGNTASTRNGQSTKSLSIRINIIFRVGVTSPVNCRVIVFRDSACNGATTGVASIFQAAVDGANDYTTSQYNVATVGPRIHFLLDQTFLLDTVQNTSHKLETSLNIGTHTRYNTGNGGGIADISENALYFCAMSDAAATTPTFKGSIRFTFTDN